MNSNFVNLFNFCGNVCSFVLLTEVRRLLLVNLAVGERHPGVLLLDATDLRSVVLEKGIKSWVSH